MKTIPVTIAKNSVWVDFMGVVSCSEGSGQSERFKKYSILEVTHDVFCQDVAVQVYNTSVHHHFQVNNINVFAG